MEIVAYYISFFGVLERPGTQGGCNHVFGFSSFMPYFFNTRGVSRALPSGRLGGLPSPEDQKIAEEN